MKQGDILSAREARAAYEQVETWMRESIRILKSRGVPNSRQVLNDYINVEKLERQIKYLQLRVAVVKQAMPLLDEN